MSLFERLRDHRTPPADDAWDDHDVEGVAAFATMLAAAWDADPADRRLPASRAAMLGAFAAATAATITPSQGALGRFPQAGAAPGIRRGGRRPALVLAAAAALLATSLGTVAASAPGGLLYDLRLAGEELLLPAPPDDWSVAQVARLDARLGEASGSADRGDTAGTIVALRAYARIATEAAAGPPVAPATAARLVLRIRTQQEVIARIGGDDPALVAAREQAQIAARAMLGALGEPGGGPGPGPSAGDDPLRSQAPSPSGSPAPATPRGTVGPGGTSGPAGTTGPKGPGNPGASPTPGGQGASPTPGGQGASPTPGGQGPSPTPARSGGGASPSPAGTAGPKATPTATPSPTPRTTPRASTEPTPPSGGGSESGSPGGGGEATPRPSSGSGGAGDVPAGATATPGGHP